MSKTAVKGVQGADTRLDMAYVVTQLSRFMENPGQQLPFVCLAISRHYGIIYDDSDE